MAGFISRLFSGKGAAPEIDIATRLPRDHFPCLYAGFEDDTAHDDIDDPFFAPEVDRKSLASFAQADKSVLVLADGTPLVDYEIDAGRHLDVNEGAPVTGDFRRNFASEAIIGSLPKGLTEVEKAEVLAKTGTTPVQSAFGSFMGSLKTATSRESSVNRRKALKGAVVVIVCAGYTGKRFILERAHELGCRTVVLDGPDTWSKKLLEEGLIENFVPIDMSDTDTLFDRLLQACEQVRTELGSLDCVTTFYELTVPVTALLAERLGLPGNSPAACEAARDKHATRKLMEEAGLPTPRNFLITSADQMPKAAKAVGFPAVIKPVTGAASMGVVRVDSEEQLRAKYESTVKQLRSLKIVENSLVQSDEDTGGASGVSLVILMEEYLDGPEVDVDLVFSGGVAVYGAVTDNWPTIEPYFNETGSNIPSTLTRKEQIGLADLCVRSVQALGFEMGVFHVEAKATSRGPRLIEVNARLGGGAVRSMNQLVWGVDLVEEHLVAMCGLPCAPLVAPRPLVQIAENSINAKKSGILQSTDFLDVWQNHPDVLYARPLVQAGEPVVCVEDGMPTWVCEVMVNKPTVQEAIAFVKEIEVYVDAHIQIA